MTYQATLSKIRASSEQKVLAAWRMYAKGHIDRPGFLRLAEAILGQHGSYAAALADQTVALELTRLQKSLVPAKGVDAAVKRETYATALESILASDGDTMMQLSRLALNAPLQASQVAYDDAIKLSGKRWVRQLDPDPCQLCRWWWREGASWPADHIMPTHPGCECVARPVN